MKTTTPLDSDWALAI